MKKICCLLLVSVLLLFGLSACGNSADQSAGSGKDSSSEGRDSSEQPVETATSDEADSPSAEAASENPASAGDAQGGDSAGKHHVVIEVADYGKITVELDGDLAPITVKNFLDLAKSGFYDGLTFHRIISGFMIQGGDPNGDGTGGSDQTIKGEFSQNGVQNDLSHKRGVISMARSNDMDSASSQFFIVHKDSDFLDGQYAAFGMVTEGMEIVDKICAETQTEDSNGTVLPENQPKITKISVID